MATAAATLIPQRQECNKIESEITQLRTKLAEAENELVKLKQELAQTAEAIALDREKPEKVNDISRRIEQVEARISGTRGAIATKDERLNALSPEARRIESGMLLAKRRAEMEGLAAAGRKICEGINRAVLKLITADLIELDGIRDRLAGEFRDLAGGVDEELCRMLVLENGSLAVELPLIHKGNWLNGQVWDLKGDIQLQIRNLRPPRK